jgi:putative redox protein
LWCKAKGAPYVYRTAVSPLLAAQLKANLERIMPPVHVVLENSYRTDITVRNHLWHADEPLDQDGTDTAPTPMEMMKGALASCVAITVSMYARRKNWPLEKIEVEVEVQRFNASDYPAYQGDAAMIHEIREKVTLHGDQLTDEQRERLLDIAHKCPVRRVLDTPSIFVEGDPVRP